MAPPSRRTKERVKERDLYVCQARHLFTDFENRDYRVCSAELTVHHRFPQELGGRNAMINLVTMCKNHHRIIHYVGDRNETKARARVLAQRAGLLLDHDPDFSWLVIEPPGWNQLAPPPGGNR